MSANVLHVKHSGQGQAHPAPHSPSSELLLMCISWRVAGTMNELHSIATSNVALSLGYKCRCKSVRKHGETQMLH